MNIEKRDVEGFRTDERKSVTVGVPIGHPLPEIGEPMISTWFKEETVLVVESIDKIEWKIYDDIKELMVTLTGCVVEEIKEEKNEPEIKILKKRIGDALIVKPIVVGEESENINEHNENPIAIHQLFCDTNVNKI